jgi:hypothetical protein
MLGQTFSRYIVFLGYQLNKEYIAKNLCENRNRPEMKCDGKCYLCKRLKKENKKDQDNPERRAENKLEIVIDQQVYDMPPLAHSIAQARYPHYYEAICDCYTAACFHPPQC